MNNHDAQGTLWESVGWDGVDSTGATATAERRDGAGDAAGDARTLDAAVVAAVRAAYFSEAGELAMRYGVGVSDVVEHLERAGLARAPRAERVISNIRCAVHATALALGVAQAWADLVSALGPGFDRACVGRLDRQDGIAFARRFWLDLRDTTLAPSGQRPARRRIRGVRAADLKAFTAVRPLRYWLAERLLGSLEVELGRAASAAERLDTVQEVRTLRIPAPMAAGAETRS